MNSKLTHYQIELLLPNYDMKIFFIDHNEKIIFMDDKKPEYLIDCAVDHNHFN